MVVYMLRNVGKLEKGRVYDVPDQMAEKMIEKEWAMIDRPNLTRKIDFKPDNKMVKRSEVKRK